MDYQEDLHLWFNAAYFRVFCAVDPMVNRKVGNTSARHKSGISQIRMMPDISPLSSLIKQRPKTPRALELQLISGLVLQIKKGSMTSVPLHAYAKR